MSYVTFIWLRKSKISIVWTHQDVFFDPSPFLLMHVAFIWLQYSLWGVGFAVCHSVCPVPLPLWSRQFPGLVPAGRQSSCCHWSSKWTYQAGRVVALIMAEMYVVFEFFKLMINFAKFLDMCMHLPHVRVTSAFGGTDWLLSVFLSGYVLMW